MSPASLVSTVSVVVPVFNSEATLEPLVELLCRVLGERSAAFEILLVDDGSRDRSWQVIERLAGDRPAVRGIRLLRNYGQHNALLHGIRAARYAVTVTLDDDLQNPPEEIPRLLAKLEDGYDLVYGTPTVKQQRRLRRAGSALIRLILASTVGVAMVRQGSSFRAFRTQLRDAFSGYQSPFVSIDALLTWGTTQFAGVPVRQDPRRAGASNYGFVSLLAFAIDVMTGFSAWPLRLASLIGFTLTLFGASVFIWVVGRYFWLGYSMPGFPFLASVIAIFSGAQLFALGIIGEYMARLHFRSMGRPASAERDRAGFS